MLLCCVAAEACSYCCGRGLLAAVAAEACRTRAVLVLQCLLAAARDATRPCAVIVTQQYRRMQNFSRVKSAARRRIGGAARPAASSCKTLANSKRACSV